MDIERKGIDVNPNSTLLVPLFRVRGGKETHREQISDEVIGQARETEAKVHVRIDCEEEYTTATAIASKARDAMRSKCVHTEIGYLADKGQLQQIADDVGEVKEMARRFNASSQTCQVEISFLALDIAVALGPDAARALADHVRSELSALRDALRAGEASKARAVILRSKNLSALAVGIQADAIRFAVEEGIAMLRKLKDAIKASESPESAGRHLPDMDFLESGIATFSYSNASPEIEMGQVA